LPQERKHFPALADSDLDGLCALEWARVAAEVEELRDEDPRQGGKITNSLEGDQEAIEIEALVLCEIDFVKPHEVRNLFLDLIHDLCLEFPAIVPEGMPFVLVGALVVTFFRFLQFDAKIKYGFSDM
jgi:hypothetical protein